MGKCRDFLYCQQDVVLTIACTSSIIVMIMTVWILIHRHYATDYWPDRCLVQEKTWLTPKQCTIRMFCTRFERIVNKKYGKGDCEGIAIGQTIDMQSNVSETIKPTYKRTFWNMVIAVSVFLFVCLFSLAMCTISCCVTPVEGYSSTTPNEIAMEQV